STYGPNSYCKGNQRSQNNNEQQPSTSTIPIVSGEDIFELQHHHLLQCLERTTDREFVELEAAYPGPSGVGNSVNVGENIGSTPQLSPIASVTILENPNSTFGSCFRMCCGNRSNNVKSDPADATMEEEMTALRIITDMEKMEQDYDGCNAGGVQTLSDQMDNSNNPNNPINQNNMKMPKGKGKKSSKRCSETGGGGVGGGENGGQQACVSVHVQDGANFNANCDPNNGTYTMPMPNEVENIQLEPIASTSNDNEQDIELAVVRISKI
ncbi:hypothetical protein RDWZM_009869, partial [Blomia tropicalis]